MSRGGWHEALANALREEAHAVVQLATIEAPNRARVRTLTIRQDLITASAFPTVPLILSMTDVRTPKVKQLAQNAVVEAVFWARSTQEQFRILGRASVVPHAEYSGPYPARSGVVHAALDEEGFDWEAKRVEMFNQIGRRGKASWCRPVPGTPLEDVKEEMKGLPERLPALGEAKDEEERGHLERAFFNFGLLVIEPFEVDYVERGMHPTRRTRFERDWEDERSVEFKETRLVTP